MNRAKNYVSGVWSALKGGPKMSADGEDLGLSFEPSGVSSFEALAKVAAGEYPDFWGASGRRHYTLDEVIDFPTLQRCAFLVATTLAKVVTDSALLVVDGDHKRSRKPAHANILAMLGNSMDGERSSSYQLFADLGADYALSGNALAVPEFDYRNRLTGMTRCLAWGQSSYFKGTYRVTPDTDEDYAQRQVSAKRMIHGRWPRLASQGTRRTGSRSVFAQAPVTTLRPAIEAGLSGDRMINSWFRSGARSKTVISFPESAYRKEPSPEDREAIEESIARRQRTGRPLVLHGGGTAQRVDDSPADRNFLGLRVHQIREASMIYGIPQLLLGEPTANWSGHIEAIMRLWYRAGGVAHIDAILMPMSMRLLGQGYKFLVNPNWLVSGDYAALSQFLRELRGDAQRESAVTLPEYRMVAGFPADWDGELMRGSGAPDPVTQAGSENLV